MIYRQHDNRQQAAHTKIKRDYHYATPKQLFVIGVVLVVLIIAFAAWFMTAVFLPNCDQIAIDTGRPTRYVTLSMDGGCQIRLEDGSWHTMKLLHVASYRRK